jgi:hypothetical protein
VGEPDDSAEVDAYESAYSDGVDAVHRSIVEECCVGAVVGQLHACPAQAGVACDDDCDTCEVRSRDFVVPIANGPPDPEMLEAVAERLISCPQCRMLKDVPLVRWCTFCGQELYNTPPPFAAAWHKAGGVRTYVLVRGPDSVIDLRAIADRYHPGRPNRGEDTPRVVRFEMRG